MGFRMIDPRRIKKEKVQSSQDVLDRLQIFLESADVSKKPVEILCRFWDDQKAAITYHELREAIKAGSISNEMLQLWQQDYSYLVKTQLNDMWKNAMKAGATSQPLVESIAGGFIFQTQTPGILSWLNKRGSEFVTRCTQQQKDAINALVAKKMIDNHTVDELARMIRPCIGLTKGQAQANAKYYDSVVQTLKKEHPKMKAENIQKRARDAAAKYAEKQHRYRAMTIAQTESAFAYNRGADEGVRQAQAQGLLGAMVKRWCTSGDDQVCSICQGLEGVEVGMEGEFEFKGRSLFAGQNMLPPAHSRCACGVEYVEVEPPVFAEGNLSARDGGNAEIPEHDPPEYLGSLADMTEDVVQSVLEEHETGIVDSGIENAVVISKSGLVWMCFGIQNAVYPNIDLGEELRGAYVTHNHPISETHFSFSYDDISLFMDYELAQLNGIDFKYKYTIQRTLKTVYASLEELEHAYKGKNYTEFLEQVFCGNADVDFDEYDFYVRRLAEKYGFWYERKKR